MRCANLNAWKGFYLHAKQMPGVELVSKDREYPQRDYLNAILEAVNQLDVEALLAENLERSPPELIRNKRLQIVSDKVTELVGDDV
ncbi:MAG: hypothetical protein CM1200mP40_26580 [Gammaproteobacteria bacterium]|nr:MAG: hypothetical protein CM1200mP40_26580 [Gammaproteobacteria bacterium]